jgi:hypothetical protein
VLSEKVIDCSINIYPNKIKFCDVKWTDMFPGLGPVTLCNGNDDSPSSLFCGRYFNNF